MATAVLGSSSHQSPWDKIKDEKFTNSDPWGSSRGSGWGTGGWDENGGWGSSSGGWGSGTGKPGGWRSGKREWGSSGGAWSSGAEQGDWGSTGGSWKLGSSKNGGSDKQSTLTGFWAGGRDSPSKPSSPKRNDEPEFSSATSPHSQLERDRKDNGTTGWGFGNSEWVSGGSSTARSTWAATATAVGSGKRKEDAGFETNEKDNLSPLLSTVVSSTSHERSAWSTQAAKSTDTQSQSNPSGVDACSPSEIAARVTLQLHETSQGHEFHPSHFISLGDGSSEYRPYPNTYDIRAMWGANYTGYYSSMDFSASTSSNAMEEAIDRNMERYYWDLRYQSELPNPSPYVQEMRHISEQHREFLLGRLAHIDFMFSRMESKTTVSTSELSSPPSKNFVNQRDRDVKRTVYKALRLLYKEWHNGADYPSILDWEGDHSMPYRVGPMV